MIELVEIEREGATPAARGPLPEVARTVVESTVALYSKVGWTPPWIGYLAFEADECVGTCAFTHAPRADVVEVAYFTFPGHEGRGVATRMAERLISISKAAAPEVAVTAHTSPLENASTRILRKLGFVLLSPTVHAEDGEIWVWRLREAALGAPRVI